jgi:large subunit ribosomal protein L29
MKMSEIKELTIKELSARRHELRQELFNLRIQQQSGQLERPHLLHNIRRDVARIETAITQKRTAAKA